MKTFMNYSDEQGAWTYLLSKQGGVYVNMSDLVPVSISTQVSKGVGESRSGRRRVKATS